MSSTFNLGELSRTTELPEHRDYRRTGIITGTLFHSGRNNAHNALKRFRNTLKSLQNKPEITLSELKRYEDIVERDNISILERLEEIGRMLEDYSKSPNSESRKEEYEYLEKASDVIDTFHDKLENLINSESQKGKSGNTNVPTSGLGVGNILANVGLLLSGGRKNKRRTQKSKKSKKSRKSNKHKKTRR
jgi:hypothetical protein